MRDVRVHRTSVARLTWHGWNFYHAHLRRPIDSGQLFQATLYLHRSVRILELQTQNSHFSATDCKECRLVFTGLYTWSSFSTPNCWIWDFGVAWAFERRASNRRNRPYRVTVLIQTCLRLTYHSRTVYSLGTPKVEYSSARAGRVSSILCRE